MNVNDPREENIVLDYPVIVKIGDEEYHAKRIEFFQDEHGFQWAKFDPSNGYHAGHQHMRRTENMLVIKKGSQED
jgi:hypothetical protein